MARTWLTLMPIALTEALAAAAACRAHRDSAASYLRSIAAVHTPSPRCQGAGGQASSAVIDAHLAVQATIRSYQVRGHLAAQIDPLGLNNMDREQAKKMIIRSVTVDEKVIQLLQLSRIFQIQF